MSPRPILRQQPRLRAHQAETEPPGTDARPESSSPPQSSTGGDEGHWYGWQILLTAGASNALVWIPFLATGGDPPGALLGLGVVGVLLGGPIVHGAHGAGRKAFGSLGLNVGVPLVLGGLGLLVCAQGCIVGSYEPTAFWGLAIGAGIGGVIAPLLDAFLLAYEPVASDHNPSRGTKPALSLMPRMVVTRDGGTVVALGGVF